MKAWQIALVCIVTQLLPFVVGGIMGNADVFLPLVVLCDSLLLFLIFRDISKSELQ